MRTKLLLALIPAALSLAACHTNGGYLGPDPALTHGPGVVEMPDPMRVYLPLYRRAAAAHVVVETVVEEPVVIREPAPPVRHRVIVHDEPPRLRRLPTPPRVPDRSIRPRRTPRTVPLPPAQPVRRR